MKNEWTLNIMQELFHSTIKEKVVNLARNGKTG